MSPAAPACILAALPLAAVLAVDPGGLAPFGPAKWALVPALVLAAAGAHRRPRVATARWAGLAWVAFLAWAVVASVTGLDGLYAWVGTPERHFGLLAWVLCALAFVAGQQVDEGGARLVARTAGLAAGALGVWATAEALGWHPIRLTGAGPRPVGPFGSSAYLGAAAALLGPAALGAALQPGLGAARRRLAGVCAAAAGVALVASGARAAWVGAGAVAIATLAVRRRRRPGGRPLRRLLLSSALVAMVAGGAAGLAVLTGVGGRAPGVVTDADGGARGRLDEWRVAVRVVARHPLAGVGPEGYRIAFGGAVDDAYEQAHGRDPLPDRAHDALLDVAVTTGLPGVLAYVLLLAAAGAFAVRALLSSPPWVAGMAAGVLAYAAQSLFLFPVAELEPVAWLLAGIVASCVARPGELTAVRAPRALPAAAAGLAAVALVAGVLDLVADRDARTALVAAGAGGHAGPGHPRRAARLRPDAVRYRLVAARALEARGSVEGLAAAVATLDTALSLSPRDPVVRSERARLLLERARRSGSAADVAAAREALERLGSADPRNAQVLLRLGLGRQLAGDAAGAEHAWLRAERLAPRSAAASTDLALAYAAASRWSDARAAALRALAREPADDRARQVLQAADGT